MHGLAGSVILTVRFGRRGTGPRSDRFAANVKENVMRQIRWMSAAVVVCALVGTAGAQEEKAPLDKLPKAVSGAVKKRFPKAEMASASKETEDGKTVFDV